MHTYIHTYIQRKHTHTHQYHLSLSLSLNCLQLKEMFGAGTACVVCPVNKIAFLDEVQKGRGGVRWLPGDQEGGVVNLHLQLPHCCTYISKTDTYHHYALEHTSIML